MGKYSVPEEIRKFKPKGTMVKVINGNKYYVYEYKSYKDDCGKRKTQMGKMIGKIIEGKGFIPNDTYACDGFITTLEYGQYKLVYENSKEVFQSLLDVFNYEDAARIYVMALISYVNGYTSIKNFSKYYEQSYLNIEFNGIKMGATSLSTLLDNLGRKGDKVNRFEENLTNSSSREIAVDGHVIPNYSLENDLADYGNKYRQINDTQVNLIMGYDINGEKPLFSRFYAGSKLDKVSIKDILARKDLSNILFIVDRGFYSKENIKMFCDNGNKYIIPLSQNLKAYKDIIYQFKLDDKFVYETNRKKSIIEYKEFVNNGSKVIIYKDQYQNMIESADYLKNIEKKIAGFTKEKYEEISNFFGLIVLETNLDIKASEIYFKYKQRWKIETFYNFLKNKNGLEAIGESDYYKMQGIAFVTLIVGLIQSNIKKNTKCISGKSISDILLEARMVKLHYKNEHWYVENTKKATLEMFAALNSPLEKEI